MKIAFLGPEETYSHLAAQKFYADEQLVPYATITKAAEAVATDECDSCIIPVENSIEGTVFESLNAVIDLNLFICAEQTIKIDHRLILKKGVALENIKKIATHSQAYFQSVKNLKKLFQSSFPEIIFVSSTARALHYIDDTTASISGAHINRTEFSCHTQPLSEYENNITRFCELKKQKKLAHSHKIFILFETPNKPAALVKILTKIGDYGFNMSKIESRPHRSELGRYVFFVDFSADIMADNTKELLQHIEQNTVYFKLLGWC